jgi:hypothetical protein
MSQPPHNVYRTGATVHCDDCQERIPFPSVAEADEAVSAHVTETTGMTVLRAKYDVRCAHPPRPYKMGLR